MNDSGGEILAKMFGGLFGIILSAFISMVVLVDLWSWFIVPFGVMEIGYAHAYGLALAIGFLTQGISNERDDESRKYGFGEFLFIVTFARLITWGLGAIAASFM